MLPPHQRLFPLYFGKTTNEIGLLHFINSSMSSFCWLFAALAWCPGAGAVGRIFLAEKLLSKMQNLTMKSPR